MCVLSLSRSLRNKEKSEKVNLSPSPAAVSFRSLEASPLTCPLCARAGAQGWGPQDWPLQAVTPPGHGRFRRAPSCPVIPFSRLTGHETDFLESIFNYKQCEVVQSDISLMYVWGCGGGSCNCLGNFCLANQKKLLVLFVLLKTYVYKFSMDELCYRFWSASYLLHNLH